MSNLVSIGGGELTLDGLASCLLMKKNGRIYGPTDGLILYDPLSSIVNKTRVGKYALRFTTPPVKETYRGIKCLRTYSVSSAANSAFPYGAQPMSICGWAAVGQDKQTYVVSIELGGDWAPNCRYVVYRSGTYSGTPYCDTGSTWIVNPGNKYPVYDGSWHFWAITYNGNTVTFYADKTVLATRTNATMNVSISNNRIALGSGSGTDYCRVAGLRLYNRGLSQAEVFLLADEYTPT